MGSSVGVAAGGIVNETAESTISETSTAFMWIPDLYADRFPPFVIVPAETYRAGRHISLVNSLNLDAPKTAKYGF